MPFVRFFGESMARRFAYDFILPLARILVENQDTQSRLMYFVKTSNDSSSKRAKILLSKLIFCIKNQVRS